MKKTVISIVTLAALSGLVLAAPFQTLGLLRTPDGYLLPSKAMEFVLVAYYRHIATPDYATGYNGLIPYGMFGVGIMDRMELGFFAGDDVYFMNAKVKLINETPKFPQVTIGMDNIFSKVNKSDASDYSPVNYPDIAWADHPDKTDYEHFSPYIVLSKQVGFRGLSWSFNTGIGLNRFYGQVHRSQMFGGSFASIEISPHKNFDMSFQGEFDGKDFNAGIKYLYKNCTFKLCAQSVEDWAKAFEHSAYKDNVRVAVGASYLFDRFAEPKRDVEQVTANIIKDATPSPEEQEQPLETISTPQNDVGKNQEQQGQTNPTEIPETGIAQMEKAPADTTGLPGQDTNNEQPVATVAKNEVPPREIPVVVSPTETTKPTKNVKPLEIVGTSTYKELSPEMKDLLKELKQLRTEREKAEKALEDLRKWMKELEVQEP